MKNIKRIAALVLAVVMTVSVPLQHSDAFAFDRNESNGGSILNTQNNNIISVEDILANQLAGKENTAGGVLNAPGSFYQGQGAVDGTRPSNGKYTLTEIDWKSMNIDLKLNKTVAEQIGDLKIGNTISAETLIPIIIEFDNESIIEANPSAKAGIGTKAQSSVLGLFQEIIVNRIESQVFGGKELEISSDFTWVMNGVATVVPYGSIDQIKEVAGVRDIYFERTYEVADYKKEDVSLHTAVDGVMIGREDTWQQLGYTGKGMTIAVIDTGLDNDHPNFGALDASLLTEDSLTPEKINAVLTQLNAYQMYSRATGETLYYNSKIAFGFNYADYNMSFNHANDAQGDHGTHVAGIAAANKIDKSNVVGVAPDAQVVIMKVFGAYGGGNTSLLITAMEDALILGVDAINMSIGANAGFTDAGDGFDEVYDRIAETDIFLAISAGNAASSGEFNDIGTDTNMTMHPDNATIASPSTYTNAMSVASVNNLAYLSDYLELNGRKFMFVESVYDGNSQIGTFVEELGGQTLPFAMVGNLGKTLEDFTSANVAGKVAIVSRGETNFTEKYRLAEEAGAIAVIIYNNIEGEFGANLTGYAGNIPCVCVTQEIGMLFAACAQEGKNTFKVSAEQDYFPNPDANLMSSFTSWGVTPDLRLKPDITGPGGYIYSTIDGGGYGMMSGTSMASPNVAGMATLVKQYVNETYTDLEDDEVRTLVNLLLTSTATPIVNEEGIFFSPRQQGTGLANVFNAITTKAYLSVEDDNLPQINLFDDPDRTGEYEYEFTINNFGDTKLWYGLNTNTQTEGYYYDPNFDAEFIALAPVELGAETVEDADGIVLKSDYNNDEKVNLRDVLKLAQTSASAVPSDQSFRYDLNADDAVNKNDAATLLAGLVGDRANVDERIVSVEAGEELTVYVTVTLTEEDKEYMDAHFENGIYVEGYTVLTGYNGATDLSLPYMGFYGDWTEAPMFDSGYYWEEEITYSQYAHVLWTSLGGSNWFPGLNAYITEEFDPNNIAVSPNGDGYLDTIEDIYVSLMRCARDLTISYVDAKTGKVYFSDSVSYILKSTYFESYEMIIPYVVGWDLNYLYDFKDPITFEPLADGTDVILRIEATPDYDAEVNNDFDVLEFTVHVDTKAPEIVESELVREGDKLYLDLSVRDTNATAAICVVSSQGTLVRSINAAAKGEPGEVLKNRIDVTGCGNNFMIVLADYAGNERGYYFEAENNHPVVDANKLFAYRIADEEILDDSLYGWVAIEKTTAEVPEEEKGEGYVDYVNTEAMSSEHYMDYALTAATYVDGYIIAVDANDELVLITPGYWDERHTLTKLDASYSQLAFDPANKILYAYNRDTFKLETIDLHTFEVTTITTGMLEARGLTVDDEGNVYGLTCYGQICKIDLTTGLYEKEIVGGESVNRVLATLPGSYTTESGVQQYYRSYSCSMTYDSNEDVFYVADFYVTEQGMSGLDLHSNLCKVDPSKNYEVTALGRLGNDSEVIGLLTIDDKGVTLDRETVPSALTLDYSKLAIVINNNKFINAVRTPWYSTVGTIVWKSSDETVATVDGSGNVYGVAIGEAIITAELVDEAGDVIVSAQCEVEVINPDVDLEAYSIYGTYNTNWISFNAADLNGYKADKMDQNIYMAGEYYDGYVYAYTQYGAFYKLDADTKEATKIADSQSKWSFYDMTYNYADGYMYAVALDYISYSYRLVRIDILTGAVEVVGNEFNMVDSYGGYAVTLAATTDGTLYTVTSNGFLCTVDITGQKLDIVGFTGAYPSSAQSMAWDHNNGGLYWAFFDYYSGGALLYIDVNTGEATTIGKVNGESWNVAMYTRIDEIPSRADKGVVIFEATRKTLVMIEGTTATSPLLIKPFNATDRSVTYSGYDSSIIEFVDGRVVGKKPGKTTVTARSNDTGDVVRFDVKVVDSVGKIRGFIVGDLVDGSGWFWGEFDDKDLSTGMALAVSDNCIYAAEFYDGKMFAYLMNEQTSRIEFVEHTIDSYTFECYNKVLGSFDFTEFPDLRDMAIDYSEAAMYAIAGVRNGEGNTSLYTVDTTTGDMYLLGENDHTFVALTCSTDGILYGVDLEGKFYEIDKTDGSSTYLFDTKFVPTTSYQSMTYDHDTGNIYWSHLFYSYWDGQDANLILIDVEEQEAVSIGKIGSMGCQVTGLHIPVKHVIKPADVVVEKVLLDSSRLMMAVGDEEKLSASTYPIQIGKTATLTYTSANPAVATVDQDGNIVAVGAGQTIITVTSEGVSNTCVVDVIGENYKVNVLNNKNILNTYLLEEDTALSTLPYSDENFELYTGDFHEEDNCYYAVDVDGYFYKVALDGTVTKIGTETLIGQFDNIYTLRPASYEYGVNDIVVNKYTGEVYGIAQYYEITSYDEEGNPYEISYTTRFFTVDTTTGVVTEVGRADTNKISEFDFISEKDVIYYDGLMDYLCTFNMDEVDRKGNYVVSNVAWLQVVLSADNYGRFGMDYCEELNAVFMMSPEYVSESEGWVMGIYVVDMNTKYVKKLTVAPLHEVEDIRDIYIYPAE